LQAIMIACRDCSEEFEFSVEDQQWHIDQGFDNQPSRCKACQKSKKERMGQVKPCYAFAEGSCTRGADCKFSHSGEGEGDGGHGGRGGGRGGRGGSRGRGGRDGGGRGRDGGHGGGGKCFAFQKGECSRGSECRFSHE